MDLKQYIAQATFSEGLPQGDTFFELDKIQLEDMKVTFEGVEKTRIKLKSEGKEFFVPFALVREFKAQLANGATRVRVTRTGTTRTDTRYTVVKV